MEIRQDKTMGGPSRAGPGLSNPEYQPYPTSKRARLSGPNHLAKPDFILLGLRLKLRPMGTSPLISQLGLGFQPITRPNYNWVGILFLSNKKKIKNILDNSKGVSKTRPSSKHEGRKRKRAELQWQFLQCLQS